MNYAILLKSADTGKWCVYMEFETMDALSIAFPHEVDNFGYRDLRAVKFLSVKLNIDDGLDDAVIGGVER